MKRLLFLISLFTTIISFGEELTFIGAGYWVDHDATKGYCVAFRGPYFDADYARELSKKALNDNKILDAIFKTIYEKAKCGCEEIILYKSKIDFNNTVEEFLKSKGFEVTVKEYTVVISWHEK